MIVRIRLLLCTGLHKVTVYSWKLINKQCSYHWYPFFDDFSAQSWTNLSGNICFFETARLSFLSFRNVRVVWKYVNCLQIIQSFHTKVCLEGGINLKIGLRKLIIWPLISVNRTNRADNTNICLSARLLCIEKMCLTLNHVTSVVDFFLSNHHGIRQSTSTPPQVPCSPVPCKVLST